MFQPVSYQDKRNALNEILLQQLANIVGRAVPAAQGQLQMILEQYGVGHQRLRDFEANRILGAFSPVEGVEYATQPLIAEYLKANFGRTYFGVPEHTAAPDGSIGTAGFGQKFGDWLASLPNFDASIGPDIVPGFYRDEMTHPARQALPILVMRNGDEMVAIIFFKYISIMALNLAQVPAEYNWSASNHYPLRGEMYTYRGDMTKAEFELQFGEALANQGVTSLHQPVLETVNTGYSQIEEAVASERGQSDVFVAIDEAGEQPVVETTPAE
jgi:hypothetical protein